MRIFQMRIIGTVTEASSLMIRVAAHWSPERRQRNTAFHGDANVLAEYEENEKIR